MEDMNFPNVETKDKFEGIMLRRLKLMYGIDIEDMEIINVSIGQTSEEPTIRIVLLDSSEDEECLRVFEIA